MTNNRQHNQVLNRATKALLFVMLFVFSFAIFLSTDTPILSTDTSSLKVAEAASSSGYYTISGNEIVFDYSSVGNAFYIEELYTSSTYWSNLSISSTSNISSYSKDYNSSYGAGFKVVTKSDKIAYERTANISVNYKTDSPKFTITKITLAATITVRSDGDNGWAGSEHVHYNIGTFSSNSTQIVQKQTDSAYGNQDSKFNSATGSASVTGLNVTNTTAGSISISSLLHKETAGTGWGNAENSITWYTYVKDIAIAIEGTYHLLGSGTQSDPYLLEERADFDYLSQQVAAGTDYSGKYFKVQPNTENGQTAYSAGGTTILMGAGAPIVQFSNYSLYTGISSNYAGNGGEEIGKLFDGNTGTKYCTGTGNAITFNFNLPSAVDVTGYYWATGNDTSSNTGRNPAYFRLYGSNDGTNWTKLDDRSNGGWTTADQTRVDFSCNTATGFYKYFKVETKANGASVFQISEFGLRIHQPFTPIGNDTKQFKGNIVGNGCTVSGLSVTGNSNYAGLFGYTNGSTISNLTVSGSVSGQHRVGGIAGYAVNTTFSNCNSNVNVAGSMNYIGGIAGYADTVTLTGTCTNQNIVQGATTSDYVGGLIGYGNTQLKIDGATLQNSATVYGGSYVGGIAGWFNNNSLTQTATLKNTISTSLNNQNEGICCNEYVAGGIFGLMTGGGTVNFAADSISSAEIDPCETNESLSRSDGVGWCIGGVVGFNQNVNLNFASLTSAMATCTINMRAKASANTTIEGITLSSGGAYLGGIVGFNGSGNITGNASINLCQDGVLYAVNNGDCVGGIVGYNTSGKITNCKNATQLGSGTNYRATNYAGGIAGYSSDGATISGCVNSGAINGINNVGGIVGYANRNTLSNLTNAGVIIGEQYVGGIVGKFESASTLTIKGTNTASVSGTSCVGGIVGALYGGNSSLARVIISHSYNSGNITASVEQAGGILGDGTSFTGIEYCYNEGSINAASKTGGIVGWNSSNGSVEYCYNNCYNRGGSLSGGTTAVNGTSGIGGIVGYQANSNNPIKYSWSIYTSQDQMAGHNSGLITGKKEDGYIVIDQNTFSNTMVFPAISGTDASNVNWTDITSKNFTHLRIFGTAETIAVGNYLSISDFDAQTYVAPASMTISGGTTTPASAVTVTNVVFNASTNKNILITKKDFASSLNSINLVYDGTDKMDTLSSYKTQLWTGVPTNYTLEYTHLSGDSKNVSPSGFTTFARVKYGDIVFGNSSNITFSIDKATPQLMYGGEAYGILPYESYQYTIIDGEIQATVQERRITGYENLSPYINQSALAMLRYPCNFDANGNIVYDNTSSNPLKAGSEKFTLSVYKCVGNTFVDLVKGTDYNVNVVTAIPTSIDSVTAQQGYKQTYTIKFTPTNSNFNEITLNFMLIISDFAKFENGSTYTDGNGNTYDVISSAAWGSVNNPYVISSWVHMVRLMEIVNGDSQPINSIANQGICQGASITQPASYDISYENGNFFVTANSDTIVIGVNTYHGIDLAAHSATVPMKPIGTGVSNSFAGNFDGNGKAIKINFESNANNVGLFGFVKSALNNVQSIHDVVICGSVTSTSDYSVGALAGQVYGNARIYNIKNYATVTSTGNYVGGIVGFVGDGVNFGTEDGFSTIENYGAVTGIGYVGGIAGLVYPGAGIKESGNTYVLGANTGFVNMASGGVSGNYYVGGIFGGMYADTNDQSYDYTRFQPAYARNVFNVTGSGNYVGGLFGRVQYNQNNGHIVYLINTENNSSGDYYNQWSYNGSPDATGDPDKIRSAIISGTNYVGGIAGHFEGGFHQLIGVFNTALIIGNTYVGGIAGRADNGRFENCFVTNPDGYQYQNTEVDYVIGANAYSSYVGGMFGYMLVSATVVNGVVQNYDYNKNGSYQGGLVGYTQGAGSNISGYAIYTKSNASYTNTLENAYGNYIIVDSSVARLMSVRELFVYAGLRETVTDNKYSASSTRPNDGTRAAEGNISIGANLPEAIGTPNSGSKMQVVFYDTVKTERKATGVTFNASNDVDNTILYVRLDIENSNADSFIIGVETIAFDWNNVTTSKEETVSWQNAYLNTALHRGRYQFNLSSVTIASPNDTLSNAYTSYLVNWYMAAGTYYVHTSRTFNLTRDHNVDGFLIANLTDWANFVNNASSVKGKVTLLTDLTLTTNPTTDGFSGTSNTNRAVFEGNNHTLTININNAGLQSGYSVFRNAKYVTFKNLTIKGTLRSTSDATINIAAFVGESKGSLTFENCTNDVDITSSSYNVGGFIGQTASSGTYVFNNCVNTGTLTSGGYIERDNGQTGENEGIKIGSWRISYSNYFGLGGTGGMIGKSNSRYDTITFDGCRNAGVINGQYNCAGLVGYLTGSAEVYSCANTATITASGNNGEDGNVDTNAAGLCALIDGDNGGHANLYASYNSGEIVSRYNRAGGLISGDSSGRSSTSTTNIFYCYNTGNVYTGGKVARDAIETAEGQSTGATVGGLAGVLVNADIRFSYNTGDVIANGVQSLMFCQDRYIRAGGIAGFVSNEEGKKVNIWNCYNVGSIYSNATGATDKVRGGYGGIVGEINKDEEGNIDIQWTWSLANCCNIKNGPSGYTGWRSASPARSSVQGLDWIDGWLNQRGHGFDGAFNVANVRDLTAHTNSDGELKLSTFRGSDGINYQIEDWLGLYGQPLPSYSSYSVPDVFSRLRNHQSVISTISGTRVIPSAWILIEGCLPQLAMFAVDTRDGLAMTAPNAGTEAMPYIIKDGVDLMGVSTLTSMGYSFNGEYIEFANAQNNLEEDVCAYISMPQNEDEDTDKPNWYRFSDGTASKTGKSYHLLEKGALYATTLPRYTTAAFSSWKAINYEYILTASDGSWQVNKSIIDGNFLPISRTSATAFKGHLSGTLLNADGENIGKAEVRGLKMAEGKSSNFAYGFIGYLGENAVVKDFIVSGNISAKATSTNAVYVGIIGQPLQNSMVDGVVAGSSSKAFEVTSYGGSNATTYTGGIIGYIGNTNGTTTISNCEIRNAIVTGCNDGTGGIIGAVAGGASANINISNCSVTGALITSISGTYLGGIVGKRVTLGSNNYGNLAIDDCFVGTYGVNTAISAVADAKVRIEGQNTIGGIISNAQTNANGSLTITNCAIFGDVYITRTANPQNNTDANILSGQLGTAIGGIAGFTLGESTSPIILRGELQFYGLIDVNVSSSAKIENIGGLIGYMGQYSIISSGAYTVPTIVYAYGKIDGGELTVYNVGGVAGISNGGALDGEYHLSMTTNTPNAISIGGFIGYNVGNTSIARTGIIESYETGAIIGKNNVGGFIGNNGWNDANDNGVVDDGEMNNNAIVNIGASSINGALYGTDSNYLWVHLYSSVDGKMHVGGFIGVNAGTVNGQFVVAENYGKIGANGTYSNGHIETPHIIPTYAFGGIVGANVANSHFNLTENAIFGNETSGQVGNKNNNSSFQFYVGGIIGVSMGELDIDPNATLYNLGEVYGNLYVGGAIGGLVIGTMQGVMLNQGAVTGSTIVGGVFGVVMQSASIGVGQYINTGEVESTANENNSIAGGVIGAMYGTINGTTNGASDYADGMANFENYGSIKTKSYSGGAIGLVEGSINNARFVNSASLTFTGGDSVGGVIGYITSGNFDNKYPSNSNGQSMYVEDAVNTSVTNTYFGYIGASGATTNLVAGASSGINTGNVASFGGVGGVIGTIDASEITSSQRWSGNSFFVNGNVIATSADAVGGVIGQIVRETVSNEAPYITINNMLAYENEVYGRYYVGGIVGYNGSSNTNSGENASISNCYNIRGKINGTEHFGGIVGGYYGEENGDSDSPKTNSSYWVYATSNSVLLNVDPNNLGETLTATWHTEISASNYLNNENVPSGYDNWQEFIDAYNANPSNTNDLIQNAGGDWGYYTSNATPYSTGKAGDYTGYFFVYANNDACPVPNGIDAVHMSSSQDINYWKLIANTADAPEAIRSNIVSGNDNAGFVRNYTIYATAMGAVDPDSSNKYYYLNIIAKEGSTPTSQYVHNYTVDNMGNSTVLQNKLYISIDATNAGNVVIYYKPVYMANNIVYDGEEHRAPIRGLTEETKSTSKTGGIYYQLIAPNGERNLENGQKGVFNVGTDARTYDVEADIWFVSDDNQIINLGRVYSRKSDGGGNGYQWRIVPKNLTLTPTWTKSGMDNNDSVEYNSYHQGLDTLTVGGLYARDINTSDGILVITVSDNANVNSLDYNQIESTDITVTYLFSGAIDASTSSGSPDGITYSVICKSNNGNYTINGVSTDTYTYSWTIEKKDYTFEINASVTDKKVVYDGQYHNINISINGGSSATETYGNDTLSVIGASGSVGGETGGCDVGKYFFNPQEADVSGVIKATRGGKDVSYNYLFSNGSTQGEVSFEITHATVTIAWESGTGYVYQGANQKQGPGISSISVQYGNTTDTYYPKPSAGATSTSVTGAKHTKGGSTVSETLVFSLTNFKSGIDAGSYTSSIAFDRVNGTNDAGTTGNALMNNYKIVGTLSKSYTIQKSRISWKYGNGAVTNINKTYDGTSAVNGLSTSNVTFSSNDGANAATAGSVSGYYTSDGVTEVSAAGTAYPIVLNITLHSSSTKNYELVGGTGTYSGNITKRGINITLNGSKIYKTYDTTSTLATLLSDVDGPSSEVKSDNYRVGRGFTAKNFVDDGVNISFRIAEETADRTELDSSINGIIKNAGVYSAPTTASKNQYLKQAIFTLDTTGVGANYFISSIVTTSGVTVYSSASEYSVVHVLDNNTTIIDGAQNGEWYVKSTLDVAINPYNVQASYQNTMQSYANEDNSYNKNWLPVTATLNVPRSMISAGIGIQVVNKWMFEEVSKQKWLDSNHNLPNFDYNTTDGDLYDNARFINKYTQYSGSSLATYDNNSEPLFGAILISDDGFSHLNLKLRNQPNVIIGYFVETQGYEISSLAGLLLATEYYKGTITPSGDETETVSITYVPNELKAYPVDPTAPGAANVPATYLAYVNDATTQRTTPSGTTWDGYVELYRDYIRAMYTALYDENVGDAAADSLDYSTYYTKNSSGEYEESSKAEWNYVLEYERNVEVGDYMDFLQIDNISGVFTQKDLELIEGQFGNAWGVGSDHLTNVLYTPFTGSVVTFIGAIFDGTFNGSYVGNGYTIDHVNIIANVSGAGDYNAGMFAHVQPGGEKNGAGMVKGIHLRNINLQVFDTNASSANGTINVGGIVGLNQSDKAIIDSSFHGTIIVNTNDANSVVNVGGIVGLDLSDVDSYSMTVDGSEQQSTASIFGAIVIANIFATSANGKVNAGGIVGGALSSNSYTSVLSMSEIYATANTAEKATVGGFVGNALGATTAQTNNGVVTVTYQENVSGIINVLDIIVDESSLSYFGMYLKDGVYRTSATAVDYAVVNKVIGNVNYEYEENYYDDYSALYGNSQSLYCYGSNNAYIGSGNDKGIYDVITDNALMAGMGDYGIHESMRLCDIIDIYVLLYEKNTITFTGADAATYGTKAYVKGDSWVAQGAKGIEGEALQIAYRQHTSLLRMFNYMSFLLNKDIRMAAEYDTLADITKTDNGENVVVSYVATPTKEVFFGNISGTGTINFCYKNTANSVLMFVKQTNELTERLIYDNDVIYAS